MISERHQIIIAIVVITIFITGLLGFMIVILHMYVKRQFSNKMEVENLRGTLEKKVMKAKLETQEITFQNISRELHDNIKLSLVISKLNLHTLNWNDINDMKRKVNSSVEILEKAIRDLKNLSRSLNGEWIMGQGLANALEGEIEKLRAIGLYGIREVTIGDRVSMEAEKELHIFRIAQEAFSNILKHSQATKIDFTLDHGAEELLLMINDNGIGFSRSPQDGATFGTGLNNIKARALLINARLFINSTPGQGTMVSLLIPYTVEQDINLISLN